MSEEEKKEDKKDTEVKEEKKEGKISGFFKKMGNKINDATYDMRAESDFNKNHRKYTVYTGAELLSPSINLYAEEYDGKKTILALGIDEDVKKGCVIVDEETENAYYIDGVENSEITFEFEEKKNTKPAMKIKLGALAESVEVIKANDKYYIKK